MLAGVVSVVPGLTALATGLKEGDRYLQTRKIVKVRLDDKMDHGHLLACRAFPVASTNDFIELFFVLLLSVWLWHGRSPIWRLTAGSAAICQEE